jgi:putative DNA primase/helicase
MLELARRSRASRSRRRSSTRIRGSSPSRTARSISAPGSSAPHARADLITKLVPAAYDLDAECPRWLKRSSIACSPATRSSSRFLQRAIGYSLTGSRERALFFLYGSGREREVDVPRGAARAARRLRAARPTSRRSSSGRATGRGTTSRGSSARAGHELRGRRREAAERVAREDAHRRRDGDRAVPARRVLRVQAGVQALARGEPSAGHPRHRQRDLGPRAADPVHRRIPPRSATRTSSRACSPSCPGSSPGRSAAACCGSAARARLPDAVRVATEQYRRDSDTLGAFLEDCCEVAIRRRARKTRR